jgi:hypothetical protein
MDEPTPSEIRALAAAAAQLSRDVDELHARLKASAGDPARRAGFRLDTIAGELRRAEAELGDTAADLARVRGARGPGLCFAEWGVCPDHGNTLTSTGGTSVCRVDGRSWGYDRLGSPCGEPVTDLVTDPEGASTAMCHGHALAVPNQDGWHVRTLPTDAPETDTERHDR